MDAVKEVQIASGERVRKLREQVLTLPSVCIERGYLWTESYKETESEPPVIRRAKALKKVLGEMTIRIGDEELIVGSPTSKRRGGAILPEFHWRWYLEEMETISTRDWDRFAPLTEEEKAKMREFLPYWEGKSLYDKWQAKVPEDAVRIFSRIGASVGSAKNAHHVAHNSPDQEQVINKGLKFIRGRVAEELGKLDLAQVGAVDKAEFLKAVDIALEAAISFARRYADLARSLAANEADSRRKAELERIAETCERVPANPARSFYEAMQSIWLVFVVTIIEGWSRIGLGRLDQYLYPFYKKDIEEGRLTKAEARELISLLYIKMNELAPFYNDEIAKTTAGFPTLPDVTLGGLTKTGRDAVNELSYLFLDAEEDVRLSAEDIIVRVNKINPDAFLIRACQIARLLRGKVKFVSDDTAIQQLLKDGKPVEQVRDYIVCGCFINTLAGRSHDLNGPKINLPLMLELALNNGVSRLTGEQLGPKTGDPRKFQSYEEVWEAYKKQVEAQIPLIMFLRNVDRQLFAEFAQTPFLSGVFHGCIEKGVDITNGGTAPYATHAISLTAIPNVGDSLAAIKKVVFQDRKISMESLIDALDRNFEGEEEILHILKCAPKFGNDDDYVDSIVNEVLIHGSDEVARYKGIAGTITTANAGTSTSNLPMGYRVGALPDGRKAGEPLSEGGISPYQGRNVNGPTATMRSVAKLDHLRLTNGSVLNMRFNPEALKDDSKVRKLASMIRTYCETGGYLVQFNIVSADTLRDAQRHPEQYRDLLVRVATYSAYFVELSPELQNDIIARTEFQEV